MKAIAALMLTTAVLFTAECMNAQTHNGHDYVDLGLPSGTLWATCNVGATTPEGYGDYFAWGETQPKDYYDNESIYKYANGSKLTKYTGSDGLTSLEPSDDAATTNWGSDWRTPTKAQWDELLANTTNQWTTKNGVKGRQFTSKKNGRKLFLPAAGERWLDYLGNAGSFGFYWSSSLYTAVPGNAWYFEFHSDFCSVYYNGRRSRGWPVRAVREH